MLANNFDKENIQGDFMATTPGRKPLSTLQRTAENTASDGTPYAIFSKTPKRSISGALTPRSRSTKKNSRTAKRKSMPFRLSKSSSIFSEETLTRNMEAKDNLLTEGSSQALNEMIREKVFESVSKIQEKYEVCLAQKVEQLNKQSDIISHLKTEVDTLRQNCGDNKVNEHVRSIQDSNDLENETQVSLFVDELLKKVVTELEQEQSCDNKSGSTCNTFKQNTLCKSLNAIRTSATSVQTCTSGTSMTPIKYLDISTHVTPVEHSNFGTSMTPVQYTHSSVGTESIEKNNSATTMTPVRCSNIETAMTPVSKEDSETQISPPKHKASEMKPNRKYDIGTMKTPEVYLTSETNELTEINARTTLDVHPESSLYKITPTQNHTVCFTRGSMLGSPESLLTPVEKSDAYTMITPIQTYSSATGTSPLVAALQPEMIRSLPPEILKAELESLAISNELLRNECDELNGKVEDLESVVMEVRSAAEQKCKPLQDKVDCLQKELDETLEINHQMELKKPNSVEEYEEMICKLQKDLLLKEKQITFFTKKASEADNLQKDLRRMYAKYNTEHQSYMKLDQEMKDLVEKHGGKCSQFELMEKELCNLRTELDQAKVSIEIQNKISEEARNSQVKCCLLEEQMEIFQLQQKENADFMEQERKGLEETATELEQVLKERSAELEATRQALEISTEKCEHFRETVYSLRTQHSEVQDELNAMQAQAYLHMLEQEKELTTVSRVLEETWERVLTMLDSYKKQAEEDQVTHVNSDTVNKGGDACDKQNYKPSLVCQVLAAVSGISQPADDAKATEVIEEPEQDIPFVDIVPRKDLRDPEGLTLVERAMTFNQLVQELEEYASLEAINEKSQMVIQQYVDEIANLESTIEETRIAYEEKIEHLKESCENEQCVVRKIQKENNTKEQEIEKLRLEVQNIEQNFEASRKRTDEMSDCYCQLIEQETKNEELVENMRIIQREFEKVKTEKAFLEKEQQETLERLQASLEINKEVDEAGRKNKVQQSFTELLEKKLKLQREVEKLRDAYAKSSADKEKFSQYYARLETKANILAKNLIKAEEEIYRLDGIVDRFCSIAKDNREMAVQSQDLCKLLGELNVSIN